MPRHSDAPLLERWGVRYFRRRSRASSRVEAEDAIHILNEAERAAVRRIERSTVIRAATVGALSGLTTAVTELAAREWFHPQLTISQWREDLPYWACLGGIVLVVTALELFFLSWDALRAVHRLSRATGLQVFEYREHDTGARVLVRAALELPNPREPVYGIDPYREMSGLRLVAVRFAYRLKVGLTNFFLRFIVRRLAGRIALRTWIPLVAIPVSGFWDGLVAWWVLREARIRVLGPSAVSELLSILFESPLSYTQTERRTLLSGVASSVIRTHDAHPNFEVLLSELFAVFQIEPRSLHADPEQFLLALPNLPTQRQDSVLQALVVAAIIDGRLPRTEMHLLEQAYRVAGRTLPKARIRELKHRFLAGEPIDAQRLKTVVVPSEAGMPGRSDVGKPDKG